MFQKEKFICLDSLRNEFRKKVGKDLSSSTINHWVHKGLLPKPRRQRLEKQEIGGIKSYYPIEILSTLIRIHELTQKGWPLEAVKETIGSEAIRRKKSEALSLLTAVTDTTGAVRTAIMNDNGAKALELIKQTEDAVKFLREKMI